MHSRRELKFSIVLSWSTYTWCQWCIFSGNTPCISRVIYEYQPKVHVIHGKLIHDNGEMMENSRWFAKVLLHNYHTWTRTTRTNSFLALLAILTKLHVYYADIHVYYPRHGSFYCRAWVWYCCLVVLIGARSEAVVHLTCLCCNSESWYTKLVSVSAVIWLMILTTAAADAVPDDALIVWLHAYLYVF